MALTKTQAAAEAVAEADGGWQFNKWWLSGAVGGGAGGRPSGYPVFY